jgi:HSP20 family molecular chaperone IbpA
MTVYAPSREGFQSLLRISRRSVAAPPWFAAPVDAQEDDEWITVIFHVPARSHGRVRVEASDERVTLWGRSRSMRVCALSCPVETKGIETFQSGDLLRLRLPKKRPATDSKQTSLSPTST